MAENIDSMNEQSELDAQTASASPHEIVVLLAVLCFAVLPDLYNSAVAWLGGARWSAGFVVSQTTLIVRSIRVTVPLLVIIKLSRVNWTSMGVVRVRWLSDILVGVVFWIAGTTAYFATLIALPPATYSSGEAAKLFAGPTNWFDFVLLTIGSFANGFAEELVIRGYLLTRIEKLLGSTSYALIITSLLFGSYHLYQGVGPAMGIVVVGLAYGGGFCLCRRLWPFVVAHALTDFIAFLAM